MIVIGLMSGTSMDGMDVAVADLTLHDGALTLRPLGATEHPWPPEVRERLLGLLPPAEVGLAEVCALDTLVGQAAARAAALAVERFAGGRADLVVSHGQTVFHWVAGGRALGTLQLGQPAWITEATGLPVVSDIRSRDISAGGQGAPLASTLDALWLAPEEGSEGPPGDGSGGGPGTGPRAALNLGGIANVTVVSAPVAPGGPGGLCDPGEPGASGGPGGSRDPREPAAPGDPGVSRHPHEPGVRGESRRAPGSVVAFDTGPANCLLDAAARRLTGGRSGSDVDGRMALAGTVRADLLARLLDEPYYRLPPPKSTGRELFATDYVERRSAGLPPVAAADLMATLTELTAVTVADACRPFGLAEVVVSGGGVRNPALLAALRDRLRPARVVTAEERGLPADGKEAYLMALLGFLSWHQIPGVVAGATGSAVPRVLGRISPGDAPLRLPPPAPRPRRLVILPARARPASAHVDD